MSLSTNRTSYYIENLGCAKNQVDAEIMISAMDVDGWERAAKPEDAAVIIVNSCGFIEPAKQESIDTVLEFEARYPNAKIVMTGCLSQRYPEDLAREIPELSGIVGNRDPGRIPEFLQQMLESDVRVFVPGTRAAAYQRQELLSLPGSAYVKVAEGCNNRCSFCAIPLIRGPLRSRAIRDIVPEVRAFVERGIREINLVAQDLAAFGGDSGETLISLLDELRAIDAHFWIRLLYIYPEHFPDDVLDVCAADARVLPYFDIPMQHASPSILKRMGRPATAEQNLELISRIRARLPHAFLRSSFIVGFYGETDEDFADLVEFQKAAEIDWVGVFTYSPEDGTPAARFERTMTLPRKLAETRRDELMALQQPITHRRVDRLVGSELDVLVEEMVPHENLALGRIYAQAPDVDGAVVLSVPEGNSAIHPGSLVPCRILRRNGLDVEAAPL